MTTYAVEPRFGARHRFARITARKARYVADLIRNRSVNEAFELLEFQKVRGTAFYKKLLRSAVANASQEEGVDLNALRIVDARADDGPMVQGRMRFRPGPQGRAMPYKRVTSHLTIGLAEGERKRRGRGAKPGAAESKPAPAEAGAKAPSAKSRANQAPGAKS
jgi:large subunit ribosomal protein L22